MRKSQLIQLYSDAGFSDKDIAGRIAQAEYLTRVNSVGSDSRGSGGVVIAEDSNNWFMQDNPNDPHLPIIAKDSNERKYILSFAQDDEVNNPTNNGLPSYFTTAFTNRTIEQRFKKTTLSQVTEPWQQGVLGVTQMQLRFQGKGGNIAVYNDFSAEGSASANWSFINRDVQYFQMNLNYGTMQQAQFSLAKIDYPASVRDSAGITIAQQQNDLGFNGYRGVPTGDAPILYGILNEPNQNPAIVLPNDGSIPGTLTPTSNWDGKTYQQIMRDIRLMYAQGLKQAQGHVNLQSRAKLCITPRASGALATPSDLGITVMETLRETYPNLEIVIVPNFEIELTAIVGITQSVAMLMFYDDETGRLPYSELFVTKWYAQRPFVQSSSVSEKVAYGLAGVLLEFPFLLVTSYGA